MKEILILSSKYNSNIEAILKYFKQRTDLKFKVLFNTPCPKIVEKLKKCDIEAFYLNNSEISLFFQNRKYDLVIMSEFYQILDKKTTDSNIFINLHPSLLPKYKGLNAIKKAYVNQDLKTGITIHYVNEKVNDGEIIFQKAINIDPAWSLRKIEKEIIKLENFYYPKIIEKILGLNVLVIGGDASEHAIAGKISQSGFLNKLYLSECNDGFKNLGEKIEYNNYESLVKIVKEKNINLVIINSQKHFSKGIVDILNKNKIKTIGTNKNTSKLEASKIYSKEIIQKYNIKSPPYRKINSEKNIDSKIKIFKTPVIKADGITMGRGVYANNDIEKVKDELLKYLRGKFDNASKTSLIEEKLFGLEVVLFSLWDGQSILYFPLCKNINQNDGNIYARALACFCPMQLSTSDEQKLEAYKLKLKTLLTKEKIKTPCLLSSELIICEDNLYLLEINTHFTDPETQCLMNYIKNDWLEIFHACSNKMLDTIKTKESKKQSYCVIVASKGYPLKTRLGIEVELPMNNNDTIEVYFSGIIKKNNKILSDKPRVLSVVSDNKNAIYDYIQQIKFEEKMYIEDIDATIELL